MGIDCTSQDSGGGLGGKLSESRRRVDDRGRERVKIRDQRFPVFISIRRGMAVKRERKTG